MKKTNSKGYGVDFQTQICALDANMCRFLCPVAAVEKKETVTPKGKTSRILEIQRNTIPFNAETAAVFYHCTGCKICGEWCPNDVDMPSIIEPQLERANSEAAAPVEASAMKNRLLDYRSLYKPSEELAGRLKAYENLLTGNASVLYFAGCTTLAAFPQNVLAFLRLMEAAQEPVAMLSPEECCGQPLAVLGFKDDSKKFAQRLAEKIQKGNYKTIVSGCPECTYMFKERYPEMGIDLGVEIKHSSELLKTLIDGGKLKFNRDSETVAFHDPCYLGRYQGIYDEPRYLLGKIGFNIVEMERNRNLSNCCGGAFSTNVVLPDTATSIVKKRITEAERTGVKYLATACPHCQEMFSPVLENKELGVKDIVEYLAERLEI